VVPEGENTSSGSGNRKTRKRKGRKRNGTRVAVDKNGWRIVAAVGGAAQGVAGRRTRGAGGEAAGEQAQGEGGEAAERMSSRIIFKGAGGEAAERMSSRRTSTRRRKGISRKYK
jgi:hypothetical protein